MVQPAGTARLNCMLATPVDPAVKFIGTVIVVPAFPDAVPPVKKGSVAAEA